MRYWQDCHVFVGRGVSTIEWGFVVDFLITAALLGYLLAQVGMLRERLGALEAQNRRGPEEG